MCGNLTLLEATALSPLKCEKHISGTSIDALGLAVNGYEVSCVSDMKEAVLELVVQLLTSILLLNLCHVNFDRPGVSFGVCTLEGVHDLNLNVDRGVKHASRLDN